MHQLIFWLLIATLLGCGACHAHGDHPSALKLIHAADKSSTIVSVSTHLSELRRVTPAPIANLDYAFRQRVRLRLDGRNFKPQNPKLIIDPANDSITWQATHSGPGRQIEVLSRLYPEEKRSQLTVAVFKDGHIVQQTTLSLEQPRMVWNEQDKEKTPSAMHSVTESAAGLIQPLLSNAYYTFGLTGLIGLLLLTAARVWQRRH